MLENLDLSPYVKYEAIKEGGKITGILITKVNLPEIIELLYEKVDPKNNLKDTKIHQQFNILGQDQKLLIASQMLIVRYCMHRVLTHFKVYQSDAWAYQIGADYYGEEIQTIHLKKPVALQIYNLFEALRVKSISEKLEIILTLEYGRLIPSVTKKNWNVRQVSRNSLYFSNQDHYLECQSDLEQEKNKSYLRDLKEYPYPRAITILNPDGQYKVIDGYHRLVGCPPESDPLIIYCLRDE